MTRLYLIVGVIAVSIAVVILLLVRGGGLPQETPRPTAMTCRDFTQATVTIADHTWQVALAQTPAQQARGLMECTSLPANVGMYFVYDEPQQVRFWMKNMRLPIDIIWISNNKVVDVLSNIQPAQENGGERTIYTSPAKIDGVLEIKAGSSAANGIVAGSRVSLKR